MNTISNHRALKRSAEARKHDISVYRREEFDNDELSVADIIGAISCIAIVIVALLLGGL